jgi:type II secretory pathway component GspD/PulD (secretin)
VRRPAIALVVGVFAVGCGGGGNEKPKPISGPAKEAAAVISRLEKATAQKDFATICDDLLASATRKQAGGDQCAAVLGARVRDVRRPRIKIEQIAVQSTFEKSFGVDWNITFNNITIGTNVGLSSQGTINVGILGNNWRAQFAASIAQGKATVVDSFMITTMNNVPAQINQVNSVTIFIPVVNQVQGAGLQTVFVPFPLTAFTQFTAIPRVNGDNSITMIIPLIFSRFIGESVGPNGERIPNQTQTQILALRRVASGQTIVVGGITNRTETTNSNGIPLLKDLPIVGSLFRNKRVSKNNNETLFFFTPTILPDPVGTGGGQ